MKHILVISIIFASLSALGADSANEARPRDRGYMKVLMHNFLRELGVMAPYLATEDGLKSPKAKEVVGGALTSLEKSIRKLPPEFKENPGFRISYGLLSDHVIKTKQVFDRGEYDYARLRINSTTQLCAACHMQTPKISRASDFSPFADQLKNVTYENASFLYTIRNYPEALAQFDKLAREYPESKIPSDQLSDLYRKKLAIFARVTLDPEAAIASFTEDLKNKNLPVDVKQNIKQWISGFEKWKAEKSDPSKLTSAELTKYAAANLPSHLNRRVGNSDPQLLNLLRTSGLLYKHLFNENAKDAKTQELLYYLAEIERSLSPLYLYSVSEIYLRECITKYPKSPISTKCFEAYKTGMNERYFGKPVPEGIQRGIEALKEYLK